MPDVPPPDTDAPHPTRASARDVRDVTEDDLARIAQLEHETFGPSAWSPALIREQFRYGFMRWRAVDDDGEVGRDLGLAGYVVYGFDGGVFHLMNLVVAPFARGRGLARALMDDFMAEAHRLGVPEASLEVAVTNEPALALYRAYGFETVRVRKRYYQPEDVDALSMRRLFTRKK